MTDLTTTLVRVRQTQLARTKLDSAVNAIYHAADHLDGIESGKGSVLRHIAYHLTNNFDSILGGER